MMIQQSSSRSHSPTRMQQISSPISSTFTQRPTLNKITVSPRSPFIFAGYSNGLIYAYKESSQSKRWHLNGCYSPYQNTDIIDMEVYDQESLVVCTHSEVTLYNLTKNKSIQLKGHQSTPLALSSHPISPLVLSVSNLLIQHDLRTRKPINVNFITPPVYDLQYFDDGSYFLLSGQPVRIGRDKWMRTLLNGMAKSSLNSKYVLTNDMDSGITMWDWKTSEQCIQLTGVKNTESYQPIHFGMKKGSLDSILFLQDDGFLLNYSILQGKTHRHKIIDVLEEDNWKMDIRNVGCTTQQLIFYEHTRDVIKIYDI